MLKRINLLLLLVLATTLSALAQAGIPRYIFYFIGDGMGPVEVMAAELYNREVLRSSQPLQMLRLPVASLIDTHSASSDVTDSAAAGTALATGHKTRNGMLGMDADTLAVESVAKKLQALGYGIGIVTSVAIDDATPGAFYAHVPNRGMFRQIGQQLAESGYQFAAGSGLRGLRDKDGNDSGLLDAFRENNVSVAYRADSIDWSSDRVLLLNSRHESNSVGYTIDSIPSSMRLQDLTAACLQHLQRVTPDAFFMMVEAGNIDHAGHANDAGTSVRETINFDRTISLAYDFYLAHPDQTLIIITADHETGGLSIGSDYTGYAAYPQMLAMQKVSKEAFSAYCKGILKSKMSYSWDDMRQYLNENLGFWSQTVPLSDKETAKLREKFEETFQLRNSAPDKETLYAKFNAFAYDVFKLFNKKAGFGWMSGKHTGSPVPIFAVGVGAQRFSAFSDNTSIPTRILSLVNDR